MADGPEPREEPRDDLAGENLNPDDAVIGRAFRLSLMVAAVAAILALGVWWWLSRTPEAGPEQAIERAAPKNVTPAAQGGPPPAPFVEVAAAAGIDFAHESGAAGDKLLPETMGSGVAIFDLDADGDQDLLFANGRSWDGGDDTPRLYRNDTPAGGPWSFIDVTSAWGLDVSLYGTGVAVGDIDNDGDPDLFLAAVGEDRLFENTGTTFRELPGAGGAAGEADAWSTSVAFFDMDGDADLDLFVANYVRWSRQIDFEIDYRLTGVGRAYGPPLNYGGTFSKLFENRGDGTFEDVSEAAGIRVVNPATGEPSGKALGLAPVDVDLDGDLDLFVANDTVGNFFFHNQGDGTFVEEGALLGVAYGREGQATGAMGVDAGTFRDDGEMAFLIGNFANEMTSLYVSQGDPSIFADEAIGEGVGAPSRAALTFGLFLFDYDLDGRLDLLQANGHLEEEIGTVDDSQSYRQSAQLFWNAGEQARSTFLPVPEAALGDLARPIVGRGAAYGDLDGDGDLDVVLTQTGGAPLVLENRLLPADGGGPGWLRLRLVGDPASGSNRDAVGARAQLTAGGRVQERRVMPTRSYQSQVELPLTFGLGDAAPERLEITWPDGSTRTLEGAELEALAGQETVLRQGEAP